MEEMDEFFQESHYNILRVLLSIGGLWPFHSISKRRTIYLVFLLVLGSGLTFEVLGMVEAWPNSFEVVDCIPLLFLGLLSLIKVACLAHTLPKIKILLVRMKKYWYSPKSDEETKILYSYALYGRKYGYAYTVFLLSHSITYISMTLLSKIIHEYKSTSMEEESSDKAGGVPIGLIYRVNYMIDVDTYYVPIFIHMAVCDVTYIILIITVDVLYLTLVQHCCGLFAALRYRLENAFEFKDDCANDLRRALAQDGSYKNIVYSIRRHAEAIQFTSILESIYRLPLLIHVGYNICIISIVGFQALNTDNMNNMLTHGIYFSGAFLNTFFENWQGQKIINYSEKVYEAVYNTQWYKMPITTKKLLIMIMMRSIKPSQLTAGKLIVMSYVNFNAVIRISSSYFMLLRSMQ